MAIMLPDQSGLSQGIQNASGALAQALQNRNNFQFLQQQQQNQLNQKNQQLSAVDQVIENSDFSTPEGTKDVLRGLLNAGVEPKDAIAIIKQNTPSTLEKLLNQYGYGNVNSLDSPAQSLMTENQQNSNGNQFPQTQQNIQNQKQIHPAVQNTPYSNIPDDVLGALSASDNPRDRDFSKNISDMRTKAHKIYNDDRNYANQKSKKYFDDLIDLRKSSTSQRIALNEIKFGLNNRDEGTGRMDWWASNLSKWTEPLISAEGNLVQSGVKNYLINDLKGVKGRPNQFLEGLLLQSLPGLGKSDLANQALVTGLEYRADIDDLKIKLTDEITSMYAGPNGMGIVPANIESLVAEQMKPIVDQWGDKHAYRLREIQEKEQGLEGLSKKKVVQGTPLTIEMMTYLADEFGLENAVKRAKQLGYRIPTKAEYQGYQQ